MNLIFPRWAFIAFFLLLGFAVPREVLADTLAGKKCAQCHRLSAEEPDGEKPGPDLFYAGSKFQKKWLVEFLRKPEVLRPAGHISNPDFLKDPAPEKNATAHPSVSTTEAETLADDLLKLKLSGAADVPSGFSPIGGAERARTRQLFERDYGCISCHRAPNLAGRERGGVSGPSLSDAGNRLRPEWVYLKLGNPQAMQAKSRMPVFKLEADILSSMTRFLMSLKKEDLRAD